MEAKVADQEDEWSLFTASAVGDFEEVQRLLKNGVNPNIWGFVRVMV